MAGCNCTGACFRGGGCVAGVGAQSPGAMAAWAYRAQQEALVAWLQSEREEQQRKRDLEAMREVIAG